MPEAIRREFVFERATKNTYRYNEEPAEGPIMSGALYIRKELLPHKPPRIIVTVEELRHV
jgi:hypothetical protein